MNSIDDGDDTAKKAAEHTDTAPTSKPGAEPDLVADVERFERSLEPDLKRAQEAAHEREMMANIFRASAAAKQLMDLRGENEPDANRTERTERTEPVAVEPTESAEPPHTPSLALRSDGRTLLCVTHLEGADLAAREIWTGVVLSEEEARDVLERVSDACDEAAGHAAGYILWSGKKDDSGGSEGGSRG